VLIKPKPSTVNSRSEVDISVYLSKDVVLGFPVIAAPMRGIVDANFAIALSKLGGIAILHRFYDTKEKWISEIEKVYEDSERFGLSTGLNENGYEWLLEYNPDILCIDVANGYTKQLAKYCNEIANYIFKNNLSTLLMSGNVADKEGFSQLVNAGVSLVRVGIGSGGLCSTRNVTGIGVPQISAIQDCARSSYNATIVADGGIRNSGDAVKAFVAGADVIMSGSLFGQTFESPSEGVIYGMASRKLQEMRYTQIRSVEGIEKVVDKKMSLEQFVDEFSWGLRSAGTYLNAKNIEEIRMNSEFVLSGKNSIKNLQ
jgi:IMP dehydrogenase